MAILIAGNGAYDLSKAFKMYVIDDPNNNFLCICYPFLDDEKGVGWTECLPLNKDTDGKTLLTYLVQAKESDVVLVWEDLLKNFKRREEDELKEEIRKLKEELLRRKSAEAEAETEEEKEDIQSLKEEIQKLRDENERLRKDYCALMSELNALRRELEEHEEEDE